MSTVGLPTWLSGKESACQCRRHKRCWLDSWVGKIPWRREWWPTPGSLPAESHGQRSSAGYSPWGSKRTGHAWAHTHAGTCPHCTPCSRVFLSRALPQNAALSTSTVYLLSSCFYLFLSHCVLSPLKHCSKELKDPTSFSKLLFGSSLMTPKSMAESNPAAYWISPTGCSVFPQIHPTQKLKVHMATLYRAKKESGSPDPRNCSKLETRNSPKVSLEPFVPTEMK